MNGTCQVCGAVGPIEFFLSEAERGHICASLVKLPKEVQEVVFYYLGLFRPSSGRVIQAKKASRLLAEIKTLVGTGYVQIDKKAARPCPPRIWALAMEQMVDRRDRLNLPMPNHKYLMSIAYDLADQADAKNERAVNATSQRYHPPVDRSDANPALDPLEKARREWDAKHGAAENAAIPGPLSSTIKGMD